MEVKPSFFSVSGFLAPGVVTLFAFFAVWAQNQPLVTPALTFADQHKLEGAAGVVAGTIAVAVLLSAAFVLGTVLSECFILIGRTFILPPLARKRRRAYFETLVKKKALDEVLQADLNTREAYVYTQTCGLDLHWYAGRVRMVGGSGLGLVLVSIYAYFRHVPTTALILLVASLVCIGIAIYRSHKFDEYVAATAAVLRFAPPRRSEDKGA